jgi:hypothetical protein
MDRFTPAAERRKAALRIAIMVAALGATVPSAWSIALRGRSADAKRRVIESAPMREPVRSASASYRTKR